MKRVAALLLFGLLASACRIDVDLRLNLQPDGSGDLDLNITTDEEFERLYRFTNAELEEFIVLSGQDIGLDFEVTEGTNKTYHADAPGLSPESIQRVLENLIPDLGTVDINAVEETLVFSGDFRPLPESQILDPFFENFDAAELSESAGITLTITVPGDVEISSASHPFYTGKQILVDTTGRVERFRKRYGQPAAKPAEPEAAQEPEADTEA